ncbi:hypothetical protein KGY79_13535, partial [Candidatus Bipolaricaulota bacterium]|nr:hypothetical protein [Candidatus Bipolaricaulota bacterium]
SIIPGPWGKKVFLFLHTAAKALGEFLIFVISKLMGEKLSGLVIPLGYMTLLSLIIVVFQFEERARRRIWQIIMLRWGFLVFRVVMEALKINPT